MSADEPLVFWAGERVGLLAYTLFPEERLRHAADPRNINQGASMKVVIESSHFPTGRWYVSGPDPYYKYGFQFTKELDKAHIYASPELALSAIQLRAAQPPEPAFAGSTQADFALVPIEDVEVAQPPKVTRRRLI